MKVGPPPGRRARGAWRRAGLADQACYVERASWAGERVLPLADDRRRRAPRTSRWSSSRAPARRSGPAPAMTGRADRGRARPRPRRLVHARRRRAARRRDRPRRLPALPRPGPASCPAAAPPIGQPGGGATGPASRSTSPRRAATWWSCPPATLGCSPWPARCWSSSTVHPDRWQDVEVEVLPGDHRGPGPRQPRRRAARARLLRHLPVRRAEAVGGRSSAGSTPPPAPTSSSRSTTPGAATAPGSWPRRWTSSAGTGRRPRRSSSARQVGRPGEEVAVVELGRARPRPRST